MAQKKMHVPTRMCCICRKRAPKKILARFVRDFDLALPVLDQNQTAQGRGIYVCQEAPCQEAFFRRRASRKERGKI